MSYNYKVFDLYCNSEVSLPSFVPIDENVKTDFEVVVGTVGPNFKEKPNIEGPFIQYNENEFYCFVTDIAKFFVTNGNKVIIEPLCEDWDTILLFFYSNCVAAILFQKNILVFHVSGVVDPKGGVWLFGAPSGTGKSTTALKLKERGYTLFTDDTALITIEKEHCEAIASYPVLRAWKNTLENQNLYNISEAKQLRVEVDKFGIAFHDDFVSVLMKINGIVFIEALGDSINIEKMKPIEGMKCLGDNIYRNDWVDGMKKQLLQFKTISAISQKVSFWKATRPEDKPSFDSFADAIIEQIIKADVK